MDTVDVEAAGAASLPSRADAVIIGAGLTGLSAARALAKRGKRTVVLEARTIGWGASSRNGGMVLTGLKLEPQAMVAKLGLDDARALDAISIRAISSLEQLVRDERIDCDFARCGHLALASKPSHYEYFKREAALIDRAFGRRVRVVPALELRAEIGSNIYHGGLLDEASAGVNPAKLVAGLARAARAAGAAIVEQAPVVSIRQGAGAPRFTVTTGHGDIAADVVIAATGAYTGVESPWLRKRIIPIGSYVIATEPLSPDVASSLAPGKRMMFDSKRFLHYFRVTPDRRMLFGGRASFVPETDSTTKRSAEILRRDMIEVYPQLADARIDYAWGGTIDFTADMLPHAGVVDGVHYAVGYAGHGVALSAYVGAQLAAAIAGGDEGTDPILRRQFPAPAFGVHRLVPGLVSTAGAWYRFLDMVS